MRGEYCRLVVGSTGSIVRVTGQGLPHLCTHAYLYPEQDSPVNKLLYAREIPRYKQMVER